MKARTLTFYRLISRFPPDYMNMTSINLILMSAMLSMMLFSTPAFAGRNDDLLDTEMSERTPDTEVSTPSKLHGFIGAELNYSRGIINNATYHGRLIPLFLVEYDRWIYAKGDGEIGAWLLRSDDRGLKFGVSAKRHISAQYGSPYYGRQQHLSGMATRHDSIDGVVNVEWKIDNNHLHLNYYRDINDVSNGSSAIFILGHNYDFKQALFDRDFRLAPSASLEWCSDKLVDYYYGVWPGETAPGRPSYDGRETFILGARLTAFLRVGRDTILLVGSQAVHYGPGITDSPLVTRSDMIRGYFGSVWQF